jgi:hypothetical protein
MPTPNPFPGPTGLTPQELHQLGDYTAMVLIVMGVLVITAVVALTFVLISVMQD